jgi:hypothetical protein
MVEVDTAGTVVEVHFADPDRAAKAARSVLAAAAVCSCRVGVLAVVAHTLMFAHFVDQNTFAAAAAVVAAAVSYGRQVQPALALVETGALVVAEERLLETIVASRIVFREGSAMVGC